MDIKSNKIFFLFALIFSFALSSVILRGVLLSPGLIEWTADHTIHFDVSWERSLRFSTWNSYIFDYDNSAILSMLSVYSWLLYYPAPKLCSG